MQQDILQQYIKKEMSKSVGNKELRDARLLVGKVNAQKAVSRREKCEQVGVTYQEYMAAQKLIGAQY